MRLAHRIALTVVGALTLAVVAFAAGYEPPRVQWRLGSLVSSVVDAGF